MPIKPIKANVTADEIVAPGSIIELTFSAPVDPQSAQGAIRVVRGSDRSRRASNSPIVGAWSPCASATARSVDARS